MFALGDIAEIIGTGTDEELLAAAEACPSTAIRVIDADSAVAGLPVARGEGGAVSVVAISAAG